MCSEAKLKFLKILREIQETTVYNHLEDGIPEDKLFEITYDILSRTLEIFDGYYDREYKLIDRQTDEQINKLSNLHDLIADYIKS